MPACVTFFCPISIFPAAHSLRDPHPASCEHPLGRHCTTRAFCLRQRLKSEQLCRYMPEVSPCLSSWPSASEARNYAGSCHYSEMQQAQTSGSQTQFTFCMFCTVCAVGGGAKRLQESTLCMGAGSGGQLHQPRHLAQVCRDGDAPPLRQPRPQCVGSGCHPAASSGSSVVRPSVFPKPRKATPQASGCSSSAISSSSAFVVWAAAHWHSLQIMPSVCGIRPSSCCLEWTVSGETLAACWHSDSRMPAGQRDRTAWGGTCIRLAGKQHILAARPW